MVSRSTPSIRTPKWQPHAFRQLLCHTLCAQKQIGSSYTKQPPTWQPPALRQLLCHTLCAQKQIGSSYTKQPPTWQPHAFRQLLCHPLCAQKQIEVATQTSLQHGSRMPSDSCYATPLRTEADRSSYTNQPPTWQLHAFRQLPPGLRKPSKEHILIFHRYFTELFRGWTCLLDFCKLLANMGLWKIVNVSAFGKPDASKISNVLGFCKNRCSTRYSSYIYTCESVELFFAFLENNICSLDVPHDIPHI